MSPFCFTPSGLPSCAPSTRQGLTPCLRGDAHSGKFTEKDYAFLMRKRAENSIKKLYCLSGKVLMSLLSPRLRPGLFSLRSVTSFRRIKKKLQIWRLQHAHITQIKNTKIFTWKFLISVIYSLFCNDIVIIVTTIF